MKNLSIPHCAGRLCLPSRLLLALGLAIGFLGLSSPASAENGLVTVSATVPGPPPAIAATIETPTAEEIIQALPVTVSGSCADQDLIISVIDNGTFVGSTTCDRNSRYSLKVDLSIGANRLVVREEDSLNQYGPDSAGLTVYYAVPSSAPTTSADSTAAGRHTNAAVAATAPLSIVLDPHFTGFTGTQAGQPLGLPLSLHGGQSPYAVHIDWGDGHSSLLSQATTDPFSVNHTYATSGDYQVTVEASDAKDQSATLPVAIVINGLGRSPTQRVITTTHKLVDSKWLVPATGLFLLTTGFYLGIESHRRYHK